MSAPANIGVPLTPYQRLRAAERARDVLQGKRQVPLRCQHCGSAGVRPHEDEHAERLPGGDPANLFCEPCGRTTPIQLAYDRRRAEIRQVLLEEVQSDA